MLAHELMTESPAMITGAETVTRAAEIMRTRGVGMLPVVSDLAGRRLVGVITDRDIVVRYVAPEHGPKALVREHMTREPLVTVGMTATEQEIADLMSRFQVRRVPVVNERGVVVGIVAQADLALAVGPRDPMMVEHVMEAISRPGALVR